ncbi:MAG: sulfatase [Myxococcota bacterium]
MMWLLAGCAPAPPPPLDRPPNVLLISLDTVRADHTTPFGMASGVASAVPGGGGVIRDTTPVLAVLAREGTAFTHAFSQGNESAWSHAAFFTGRYASELAEPVYETYGIPPGATFVSEALQAYGYQTAMFSAGGHVTPEFGFDQGWDHASAKSGFASLFDTTPAALQWIAAAEEARPWFVFLHGYDAHRPYSRPGPWDHVFAADAEGAGPGGAGSRIAELMAKSPCISEMVLGDTFFPELTPSWFTHTGGSQILAPESYARLEAPPPGTARVAITDADRRHVKDHYDGALLYADTLMGQTLATLQARGDLDNTVVIVLSDHGEDLLDHGFMNHRTCLTDSCTRVPMVAWGPGFEANRRVDALVDGRDVAATLLALGRASPPAGSGGRDLRAVARGEDPVDAVFAEGVMDMVTVRTATHRLVYRDAPLEAPDYVAVLAAAALDGPHFELFDLRADPGELRDVHRDDPATTAALRDKLVAWRSALRMGDYTLPQDQVSPETAASLRAHGYWGAEGSEGGAEVAGVAVEKPRRAKPHPDHADTICADRFLFLDGAAP